MSEVPLYSKHVVILLGHGMKQDACAGKVGGVGYRDGRVAGVGSAGHNQDPERPVCVPEKRHQQKRQAVARHPGGGGGLSTMFVNQESATSRSNKASLA